MPKFYLCILALLAFAACSDNVNTPQSETAPSPDQTQASAPRDQTQLREAALTSPEWIPVDSLPQEWGGLYTQDCVMAGPEGNGFFDYRNAQNGHEYLFSYIVFPKSTGRKPQARAVKFTYSAWQNAAWPAHYLVFDSSKSFKQIETRDGRAFGLHPTLDGEPWEMFEHIDTQYRQTDTSRWAVDIDNTEDYGSTPACDPKLATPWFDVVFETQTGETISLKTVMEK